MTLLGRVLGGPGELMDDRGVVHTARPRRVAAPTSPHAIGPASEGVEGEEQHGEDDRGAVFGRVGIVMFWLIGGVVLVSSTGSIVAGWFGLSGWIPTMLLGIAAIGSILIGDLALRWGRWRAREIGKTTLAEGSRSMAMERYIRSCIGHYGRCPLCCEPLDNAGNGADGVTVCPECAAAWHVASWSDDGGDPGKLEQVIDAAHARGLSIPVRDGRGSEVPILIHHPGREQRRLLREFGRLRGSARFADELIAVAFLPAMTTVILIVFAAGGMPIKPTKPLLVFTAVTWAVIYGLIRVAGIQTARRRRGRKLARVFISENLCPCCESTLRPTPSPIDARLLCDTCGSAWDPPAPQAAPLAPEG